MNFSKSVCFLFVILLAVSVSNGQTEVLDNDKIMLMSQEGLSDSLIIRKINSDGISFDLSTNALVTLKKAGVSDLIINTMFDASAKRNKPESVSLTPDSETHVPLVRQNTAAVPDSNASRIVLGKGEALLSAKTIAIEKSSLHPSRQSLEKELMKRSDWQSFGLNIVRLKDDADLYIEIGYVSMSWITHRYVYRVYDRHSGTVIIAGETTSWGSLPENLARGISKRLAVEYAAARKKT